MIRQPPRSTLFPYRRSSDLLVGLVSAAPNGAPEIACEDMRPQHGIGPQPGDTVIASIALNSNGDGTFTVELTQNSGAPQFKGFLIQVREEGSTEALGTFSGFGSDAQGLACSGDNSAITHTNNDLKSSVSATWTPSGEGTFYAVASVVEVNSAPDVRHWIDIRSADFTIA